MLSSLKKWVQDVTVDLTPPPTATTTATSTSIATQSYRPNSTSLSTRFSAQPSPSSPSFFSSPQNYSYSSPRHNERLSATIPSPSTTMAPTRLSRPVSMDSVRSARSSKVAASSVPPLPASPVELDLSHLNREEQEHIANVLKRARAAATDEQTTPTPTVPAPPTTTTPVSIQMVTNSLSRSSASSSSSSSSSSTSSLSSKSSTSSKSSSMKEQAKEPDQKEPLDNNKFDESVEPSVPESTLITIHRCQVCNKELPANTTICSNCQEQNDSFHLTMEKNSSSLITPKAMRSDDDDRSQISSYEYPTMPPIESTIDNFDDEENQARHAQPVTSHIRSTTMPLVSTRANNLTEIDEDDFIYQGPSPYATVVDFNTIIEKKDDEEEKSISQPSYRIDEDIDEDEHDDERDHVKELEETIANLSRHFPLATSTSSSISQIENFDRTSTSNSIVNLPSSKIDIDSILEMEIESPSTDECFIQSTQHHPLQIPITIPISMNNRRGSLSRSSGVRENLTNLLLTTGAVTGETSEHRPLQRAASTYTKRGMGMHRPKRHLPSVPTIDHHLQLRRANSESRFRLPAVPPASSNLLINSNLDDESDLLEIDLNDPTGSINRAARSKTESEIAQTSERIEHQLQQLISKPLHYHPSVDELSSTKKLLKDQTTNTPPISSLNLTMKTKKKLKKKGSTSPSNSTSQNNGPSSPTRIVPPAVIFSTSPEPPANLHRPKLQKSTSTEITYPFPVSKLILIRDNLSPSRQNQSDLGFSITGGHSIPHYMEVTARIEKINSRHRNYNILKNAVQEGDEVLEVGGVPLRGKSALFVQNLMNSIQNEFEIIVRSQHVIPPSSSQSIELQKREKNPTSSHSQHNTLAVVDPNTGRRHSMDTSTYNQTNNSNFVKSQSTMMHFDTPETSNVSDQLPIPAMNRKKSVSSKERLFSVESVRRRSSAKSVEYLTKNPPTGQSTDHSESIKRDEPNSLPSLKQSTLTVNPYDHKSNVDESTSLSQPTPRRRLYEHRNSLLPNDPGLNGAGSNASIDRRNSNESDESDNLSQYFRSSQSRKSSLMTNNEMSTAPNTDASPERNQSIPSTQDEAAAIASRRLQSFLQSSSEKRASKESNDLDFSKFNTIGQRKSSSALGSFKFLRKKTKSMDATETPSELRENDYVGDIEIQIGHNSDREQLVIRIIRAKNLLAKDTNGYSDPFVKVYLLPGRDQENKRRTKHISKTLNPVWDYTVTYGNMHREELQYKMLEFTVWDYDRFKANDFLGQVTIDLKDANVVDDKPHWYRLQALRSRDEVSNRGSSPGLYKMQSVDSTGSSTLTLNKNVVNLPSRPSHQRL